MVHLGPGRSPGTAFKRFIDLEARYRPLQKSGLPPLLPPAMAAIFLTRARLQAAGRIFGNTDSHRLGTIAADQNRHGVGGLVADLIDHISAGVSAPVPVR